MAPALGAMKATADSRKEQLLKNAIRRRSSKLRHRALKYLKSNFGKLSEFENLSKAPKAPALRSGARLRNRRQNQICRAQAILAAAHASCLRAAPERGSGITFAILRITWPAELPFLATLP